MARRTASGGTGKERTMASKLTYLWSDLVGRMLMSLVLLGIAPVPAASDPQLLWRTQPQHG